MKAITSIAAAAVLILGTLPATADQETDDKETRRGKGHASLLEELDLSEEQKTQVDAILKAPEGEEQGAVLRAPRDSAPKRAPGPGADAGAARGDRGET